MAPRALACIWLIGVLGRRNSLVQAHIIGWARRSSWNPSSSWCQTPAGHWRRPSWSMLRTDYTRTTSRSTRQQGARVVIVLVFPPAPARQLAHAAGKATGWALPQEPEILARLRRSARWRSRSPCRILAASGRLAATNNERRPRAAASARFWSTVRVL